MVNYYFCRAETNIRPWRSVIKEIKEGNKRTKWKDRVPFAYWKGNPHVTPIRKDLIKCNITDKQNFNTLLYVQVCTLNLTSQICMYGKS